MMYLKTGRGWLDTNTVKETKELVYIQEEDFTNAQQGVMLAEAMTVYDNLPEKLKAIFQVYINPPSPHD